MTRFLIIDGYPKKSRDDFDTAGMPYAHKQYADMLVHHLPKAEHEVWLAADNPEPPAGPQEYAGVLWTGCNLTIYDEDDEQVARQIPYCQQAYRAGTPQYGSCWGLQMAVVAAGGKVEANPLGREMGLARNIQLTADGRGHPFYKDKPEVFSGFISHVDQVTQMPPGGKVLASNDFTHVQAVAISHEQGAFWAVQYHPEYSLADMARLIVARESKLLPEGFYADRDGLLSHVAKLESLAEAPGRKDLRWQLAIGDDVLDQQVRQREFANWLHGLVLPRLAGGVGP